MSLFKEKKLITYYISAPPAHYAQFAADVDRVLHLPDGWARLYDLRRVSSPHLAVVRMYLTPRDEMVTGPAQYRPDGSRIYFSVTYQSPYTRPQIYFDFNNWHEGVPQSGLSLAEYREYVINHEFGHALGFDHQPCGDTGTCPVMFQSTRGCGTATCGHKITPQDLTKKMSFAFFYL